MTSSEEEDFDFEDDKIDDINMDLIKKIREEPNPCFECKSETEVKSLQE